MIENRTIGAIILAAGKGSRMKSKTVNKVTLPIADKPMIVHSVELLERLSIHPIVIVVGFAKESVMSILGEQVYFAEQTKRLGTAHAALQGLKVIEKMSVDDVLVVQGDDSAFYKEETIASLIKKHTASHAVLSFLTIEKDNPTGLGRVIRDTNGGLHKIVEEKDATDEEKRIKEINPACYVFSVKFLQNYLPKIQKSPVTGEYYITSLIDLAITHGEIVETMQAGNIPWRGVNTPEELKEAESLFIKHKEL